MTDDPGFRRETHATVEPTLEEQVAHWKARAEQLEQMHREQEKRANRAEARLCDERGELGPDAARLLADAGDMWAQEHAECVGRFNPRLCNVCSWLARLDKLGTTDDR